MKSENSKKETVDKTSKKTTTVKKDSKGKAISITKFKDLEGKFLHVKVGNADHPALVEDIKSIQEQILALFERNNVNCLAFVTHHAVDMDIIEKDN
jgi:hypothetical protein